MPGPGDGQDEDRSTVHSGGPCPRCEGEGALLILRRRSDGRLLLHCPGCGLSFTHEEPGVDPEAAESLAAIAPAGADAATLGEIARADLGPHATPFFEGALEDLLRGKPAPARGPQPAPPPRRPARKAPVPAPRKEEESGVLALLGGVGGLLLIIKIALAFFASKK
ncbi:MAG: hypothetical protein L6R43_03675 [Planctomycetes bacterium]|nr:hypothetical protein [Planctomycetota bacterium]